MRWACASWKLRGSRASLLTEKMVVAGCRGLVRRHTLVGLWSVHSARWLRCLRFFAGSIVGYVQMMARKVTMYWRPGCGFCAALKRNLDAKDIEYEMRNIWDSEEDAAFVRSVARGNETVPTVTVGEVSMVNPSADEVLAAMADA